MTTECCSESRMRSRTSRGVPEWSRGKELYIGSAISAIGTSFGVTGIVPGPPEGSRGSTGWGHLSRRAPWAEVGREPAPSGLVRPLGPPPAPRVGNPRGGGATLALGGKAPPLAAAPPTAHVAVLDVVEHFPDLRNPPEASRYNTGKNRTFPGTRTTTFHI